MHSSKRRPLTSREAETVNAAYEIGPFRLDPEAGVLTRLEIAEPLGPRAVAVLAVLVKNAHQPITKDALMEAGWPGLVVEEANLSVQMSSIRRVLAQVAGGERWIETLARRGYRFIGPVTEVRGGLPQQSIQDRLTNLPQSLTSFVGRERELIELKRLLAKTRLLTLVGLGGIGKTRLAVQLAAEVKDAYRDGVWFIDFAPLDDPELVANVAAQALGVPQSPGKGLIEGLARHVKGQRLLLIFDNCEHVLDASARLADAMLRGAPEPTIIATSREPLRIEGEQLYRLAALSLPDAAHSPESVHQSEAVLLFVDRAQHQRPEFALTAELMPQVAQLCIRLDGIPFALELAAALIHAYSIGEINVRLDDRFDLLTDGNRTALPRHQTLRATLDWSYGLLTEAERTVLRRVSVFRGGFTGKGAVAVGSDLAIGESAVVDVLLRLVTRSLIVADPTSEGTRYGLLETTRGYAQEKLSQAGEASAIKKRHAQFLRGFFEPATDDYWRMPDAKWRSLYAPEIDNIRAAIDWAFGPDGEPVLGVGLCAASGAIWWELSLRTEGPQRIQAALANVATDTPELEQARLWFWLGYLGTYNLDEVTVLTAFERSAGLSRRANDTAGVGRSLALLGAESAYRGRVEQARTRLTEAQPFLERAGQPKMLAECFIALGYVEMSAGRPEAGQRYCEKAASLSREAGAERVAIGAIQTHAYIHWSSGDLDAAIAGFREAALIARRLNRRAALGQILTNLAGALTECGQLTTALSAAREGLPMRKQAGQVGYAIDHLALRAAMAGNAVAAARLAGFADFMHAAKGGTRQPIEARARERVHALLGETLGADQLNSLLAEGAHMSEDEACRIALED
jgi:predicted ATPase/DNA-binding winged helix-turn-helix (wHTH) protein